MLIGLVGDPIPEIIDPPNPGFEEKVAGCWPLLFFLFLLLAALTVFAPFAPPPSSMRVFPVSEKTSLPRKPTPPSSGGGDADLFVVTLGFLGFFTEFPRAEPRRPKCQSAEIEEVDPDNHV